MAYLNIPEDQLSNIIATLLGQARAEIDVELRSRVDIFVNDFTERSSNDLLDSCPPVNVLEGYIKQIDRIKSSINNIRRRISKITELRQRLNAVQRPLNVGVNVLLRLPIPSRFLTAGIQNTFSDTLNLLKELNKSISSNVTLISSSTEAVNSQIDNLERTINSVDALIQACIQSLQDGQLTEEEERAIKELLKGVRGESDAAGDVTFPINYTASDGTAYVFEIQITEPDNVAPRRRAVAKDSFGIIRAIGEQSFSSSTEILVRELEFQIEQLIGDSTQNIQLTLSEQEQAEVQKRLEDIESNLPLGTTAELPGILTNNISAGSGTGISSLCSLTQVEKDYLFYVSSSRTTGTSISSNCIATFTSKQFITPPEGFASASQNEFTVFINGTVIPTDYRTVSETGSDIQITFDTSSLGYSITGSQDEVFIIGKFRSV